MRKFSCAVMSCLALGLSTTAAADEPLANTPDPVGANDYAAAHTVLYIPIEEVTLTPSMTCIIPQSNEDNPGLGCTPAVTAETMFTPVANIDELVTGVTDALAPYNIIVTTTRPASYVPYQMLIPQTNDNPMSTSETCVAAATDCDGIDRNDIGFTIGASANCMMPDPLMSVLIAFGRMSGLEGKDNAMDVMMFPPDFMMPVTTFADTCDLIVTPEDPATMMPMPLACPSSYHEASGMCTVDDQQNSHQELLAVYGPADPAILTDTTAPEIGTVEGIPEEGAVLPAGSMISLSAPITDDSGVVAVRIAIESPALLTGFGAPDGLVDKCTAGSCGVRIGGDAPPQQIEFANGADMAYADQSQPFVFSELAAAPLPGGDYVITVEASDLAGNVATPITVNFTVEGGATDETAGPADSSGDDNSTDPSADSGSNDNGNDSTGGADSDGGSNVTGDGGGDEGCACTTDSNTGNAAFLLLGIAGLAIGRRRRAA